MRRIRLFGINIDCVEQNEIYPYLLKLSEDSKPYHIVLMDTYLLMKSLFNNELKKFVNSAALVVPVSKGIKFGLSFLKINFKTTYNYFNFIIGLLLYFCEHERFIYILGGKKKNMERLEKNIKDSFPGIRLVGKYHVQYKKSFEKDLLTAIKKTTPALILIGMRPVKQEKWIATNISKFSKGIFVGVGDFVNIVSGDIYSSRKNKEYKISRKYKNPFRFFYYVLYGILLVLTKIFKK